MSLIYVIAGYGILAWYFDNVISTNRGVPKPWYFIFDVGYWLALVKSD